jgi:hypothetical protein
MSNDNDCINLKESWENILSKINPKKLVGGRGLMNICYKLGENINNEKEDESTKFLLKGYVQSNIRFGKYSQNDYRVLSMSLIFFFIFFFFIKNIPIIF